MDQVQKLTLAAGTDGRASFAPSSSTRKWKLKAIAELPNAALVSNGTDFVTRSLYVGSTEVATAKATSAAGLTQGTAVNWELTGTPSQLEVSQASPLTLRVANSGSGKAYDCSIEAEFEELRV